VKLIVKRRRTRVYIPRSFLFALAFWSACSIAQDRSIAPGINQPFVAKPDYEAWAESFEREGREVFDKRNEIVAASGVKAGMTVADVGAGTGLFTRLFAQQVGTTGKVYAVDITKTFVDSLTRKLQSEGITNVEGYVNTAKDVPVPPASVDIAFVSDTYHHFEYPQAMLAAIRAALKSGGSLVIVEFERIEGKSSPRILEHVRANKETVIREIEAAGFRLIDDRKFMQQNYFVRFVKPA
jgi:ubiquinone/menaquinone biosynthesis C-methylase UbiE